MFERISFNVMGDSRGELIAIEEKLDVPFEIKRFYYIYGTSNGAVRGKHAHRNLEQVLFPIQGSCTCLLNDGSKWDQVELRKKNEGIYLRTLVWRELINFSNDCILGVLASDCYNENDYIRSFDEFISIVNS